MRGNGYKLFTIGLYLWNHGRNDTSNIMKLKQSVNYQSHVLSETYNQFWFNFLGQAKLKTVFRYFIRIFFKHIPVD